MLAPDEQVDTLPSVYECVCNWLNVAVKSFECLVDQRALSIYHLVHLGSYGKYKLSECGHWKYILAPWWCQKTCSCQVYEVIRQNVV